MSDHRCDLPFTGSRHQCPVCGKRFYVTWFHDPGLLPWKGWAPVPDTEQSEVRP